MQSSSAAGQGQRARSRFCAGWRLRLTRPTKTGLPVLFWWHAPDPRLRSHLQNTPHDLAGWQLLGRLGLLLNDGETAISAFGRAHALAADDPAAAFDYASALVRAGDSGQVRMGELLLRDLHQRQPNSLPVLEMLALSAVRNEDYPEAVAALQALLARLPEGDARREAIVRQLAQAQQQAQ